MLSTHAIGRLALLLLFLALSLGIGPASARDPDGRYRHSPLHDWFESLESARGPCCSDADGIVIKDVEWRTSKDGKHFSVYIAREWVDVPDDAVLKQPNLFGKTMVWPYYLDGHPIVRCFIPGSMT
ncbi:hypothetical protein [Bradyrhizobium sp. SZCCHNS3002]|uniref:hypothetical protein n=1 Tax=Bradyrhizobium sp. SZCCHNS3002 TaxID=3057310 RepID=UPI0028EDA6D6|nr:hypothetical protein [Bradyrhizobium sp. SZCCHNS3002]